MKTTLPPLYSLPTWRPDRHESFLLLRRLRKKMRAKWSCCASILSSFFGALQCCVLYKLKRCLRWIPKWQLHSLQLLWKWKWQKGLFHLKIFPDAANPRLLHPYRGIARGGKHSWDVQCCAWTKWLVAMRSMRSLTWNILTHLWVKDVKSFHFSRYKTWQHSVRRHESIDW